MKNRKEIHVFSSHPLWILDDIVYIVHASDPVEVVLVDLQHGDERVRVELEGGSQSRNATLWNNGLLIASGSGELHHILPSGDVAQPISSEAWSALNMESPP